MIRNRLGLVRHFFASFNANKDYYATLNLQKTASNQQIKKSFLKMAKQYHPDANKGNQQKFKQINEAYQVLSNQSAKRDYDQVRREQSSQSSYGQGFPGQQYRQQYQRQPYNTYRGYQQDQGWQNRNYREETIRNTFRKQQQQFTQKYSARTGMSQQQLNQMWSRANQRNEQYQGGNLARQFEQMMKKRAEQVKITRESARRAYEEQRKYQQQKFKNYREKQQADIEKQIKDRAWKMAEGFKQNVEGAIKVGKFVKQNLNSAGKLAKSLWEEYKNYKNK